MFVLIVVGFLYGSALGIRAEAIMTVAEIRFKTEAACKEAQEKVAEIIKRVGRGGEAFCIKDG